jgi:type II secretory pathway pseudopilin PulG
LQSSRLKAFTLIELIFSIVIIGITFMTIPQIIAVSTNSISLTYESKGLYNAIAQMQLVLSRAWDQNSETANYDVLETGTGVLTCTGPERNGFYTDDGFHRKCDDTFTTATAIGMEDAFLDDIDDYDSDSESVGVGQTFDINTTVTYTRYQATHTVQNLVDTTTISNLKHVQVQVNDTEGVIGRYHYYAGNIGSADLFLK